MADQSLVFKVAAEPEEFDQIYQLNYATFVEEIPQHSEQPDRRLVDKLHDHNTYIIGLTEGRVIAMVSVSHVRPFSLDRKLENLDSYLPPHRFPCELRLLAVHKEYRMTRVFAGLMGQLAQLCEARGYDLALISGTTRQLKLYRHLGFTAFGPLVGTGDAPFQPMYLTEESFRTHSRATLLRTANQIKREPGPDQPNLFLPGPVAISPQVAEAFQQNPVSHRAESFQQALADLKADLCRLVNAPTVTLLLGSGTLANDAIAAQLTRLPGRGVVLSNGEFGERLADHASRFGLDFVLIRSEWGRPLRLDEFRQLAPGLTWAWAVHCETSTGMVNPVDELAAICNQSGLRLCLDSISAVGAIPVDLSGVHLASAVSGKGLQSYPGLSMVFHHGGLQPAPTIPRYLDLGLYDLSGGVAFTQSSNLLFALKAALQLRTRDPELSRRIAAKSAGLRQALRRIGFRLLLEEGVSSPAVITVALPPSQSSQALGDALAAHGLDISYRSRYLLERNWVQICLMTDPPDAPLDRLVHALAALVRNPAV